MRISTPSVCFFLTVLVTMPNFGFATVLFANPVLGTDAHSNSVAAAFGARRVVLADFTIPVGESWEITDFHWNHIWQEETTPVGVGTGMEMLFRADAAGTPGAPITGLVNITSYSEIATGNSFFGSAEATSSIEFDPIFLGAGTYWFEATIVGPENNFWLNAAISGSELWFDYDDFPGGLRSGDDLGYLDLNFTLTGNSVVPEPSTFVLVVTTLGILLISSQRRKQRSIRSQ